MLSDPGTAHEYLSEKMLGGNSYEAFKSTFGEAAGDTPDDWYIVYKDENSDLLAAMAYIITRGETSVEDAEKSPHVITYEAYVKVKVIPVATQWNFWTCNQAGEMNKLLRSSTVSNVDFLEKPGDTLNFTKVNS